MKDDLSSWLKKVQATQDFEIDCTVCLDLVSDYVDLEMTGEKAATQLPQVAQHLKQCKVCSEEYLLLRDMARLERDGEMPSKDDLVDRLSGK